MTTTSPSSMPEAIAVVGMAGRWPGANNPSEFWTNLASGVESITRSTPGELEFSLAQSKNNLTRRFASARGVLAKAEYFDAAFFGITPKDAEVMDPQHRQFLECAWEALENGGYDPFQFPGLVGVYAGQSLSSYLIYNLLKDRDVAAQYAANYQVDDFQTLLGNEKDFLSTRVSYKLNLRGPSLTIQTACSTSLVAISQACTGLLNFQCDLALAGGVSISFPQRRDYVTQEESLASMDGTCRSFDAAASGTVFGHGVGIVLLKRWSEAVAEGDNILAIIRGTALNNDGAGKMGYAAPSVTAQAEVIALAQAAAGVSADAISYVEAHGTATPLGDPIEVAALTQAFRQNGATGVGQCALGTAKTNIGHLDAAAGVTGLIKTILQLQHEKIAPLVHFRSPNPKIDFAATPFYPVAQLTDWKRTSQPRLAGVSAFGIGGTNAHLVVEESPVRLPSAPSRSAQLLVLSARSPEALAEASARLASELSNRVDLDLADAAFTLQVGRKAFPFRRTVVASSVSEAVNSLRIPSETKSPKLAGALEDPAIVFVFPGQGSQYVGMGRTLYANEPVFKSAVDRCAELLKESLGRDLREILFPAQEHETEAARQLNETWLTQPAIFTIEYALATLWLSWGIKPALLIGHSVGEYVAAVLAETFTLPNALVLLAKRARLMQGLPAGSMLAVRADTAEIEPFLTGDVAIAAYNGPRMLTLSGPRPALEALQTTLATRGIGARLLATSHAFHSAMMEPILPELRAASAKTPAQAPRLPWISTLLGRAMTAADLESGDYWARQIREPVRFSDAIRSVPPALANCLFLEVGPGQALGQLVRQQPDHNGRAVFDSLGREGSSSGEITAMLATLGRLWERGVRPDWIQFHTDSPRRRVALPTYPFEHKRFWVEAPSPALSTPMSTTSLSASVTSASIGDLSAGMPANAGQTSIPVAVEKLPKAGVDRLAAQVRTLFRDLSGIELTDDQASFMELGFDSLFLTQASQALQTKFGVKVAFRQLLAEQSTVAALAAYLHLHLPEESAPNGLVSTTPASVSVSPIQPGSASSLEQLLAQQMQLIQAAIAQSRQPASAPSASDLKPVIFPGTPPASEVVTGQKEFKRFGPYKPVEKGEKGGLTPRQQAALDGLVSRYVAKTGASKAYTAKHRKHYADPRAVSGFKSNWKEIVYPIVSTRSKGSKIWDLDGHEYIDITMGFGTYFFGHSPEWLMPVLEQQLRTGVEIGPQSPLAGDVARQICEFTGMERATFCNTGSEAVMAAIRLARVVTGRKRIVYFTGDYHGMFEEVLVRASWIEGQFKPQPIAPGIPSNLAENMLILEYGAPSSLELIKAHASEIAAVLVEPVQSRHPAVQPRDFLRALRTITEQSGTALIFDEVVTGFRCHPGGAQAYFGVKADLATYGKVVGGGMPIGVLAGKKLYLDALDGGQWNYGDDSFPEVGMTFFAGTFVRHPLAVAAADAVLKRLRQEGPYLQQSLTERVARTCRTLNEFLEQAQVPIRLPHFSGVAMIEYAGDLKYASLLWYYLREKGIHIWEGRPCIFTLAHTDEDLDRFIAAFQTSVAEMQEAGFLPTNESGTTVTQTVRTFPRADIAPSTEGQKEIFYSVHMGDEANCAYNEASIIQFHGPLDIAALERAFHQLVQRHAALRSTFSADGEQQIFHAPPAAVIFPRPSLRDLTPDEAAQRWRALCSEETNTAFDLTAGPLWRAQLVERSEHEHALLFTAHHLVCDGWSWGIIVSELSQLYNAARQNQIPLLPLAMSFADYARHEIREKNGDAFRQAEQYWLDQYKDGAPVLELPTDRPRPAVKTYRAAMAARAMDSARFVRLKQSTGRLGGTLFTTLLSAFATLMHRITGQSDLVVGVPAAGQTMIGCSELVGHCLNFLPLRVQVDGSAAFDRFAKGVQKTVLDAYDHQQITFGALLKKLKLPRDSSRLPLVSVMFNIDKSGADLQSFRDLRFEVETNPKQFTNFELFFNLVQTETSLVVECEYNTDLFDHATIEAWLECYETLVESVLNAPARELDALPLLSTAAQTRWLREANATKTAFPEFPVYRLIEEQTRLHPEKIAVRCGNESLTYAQLDQAANKLAMRLQTLGAKPGVLVGLCLDRSVYLVVGVLGVLKAGAAYVPLDPAFPRDRLTAMAEDGALQTVVAEASTRGHVPPFSGETLWLEDVLSGQPIASRPSDQATPRDPAYVIFTSGSTGRPKGVAVSHRALVNFLNSMRREPGFTADDVLLSVTTLSFDIAGLELYLPLIAGGTVVVAARDSVSDGQRLREELAASQATVMQATPVSWRLLREAGWPGQKNLRVLIGGEAVPRELANDLAETCGSVWNMYGPTETTIWSTTGRIQPKSTSITIGRPIDNTQVYIVNARLEPQPLGVPGELLIGGDGLAEGYLNRPELTQEKFIPNPFAPADSARLYRTGDLARWRASGELECLGRLDHQVKLRGFRIELGEIETLLAQHPGIKQAVVALRDDGQKKLIAYIVPHTETPADLRAHLSARLPDYMIPSAFLVLDKIPLTPNGKIDRKALPAPAQVSPVAHRKIVAPRNKNETVLVELCREALRCAELSIEDDIFELGIDSILIFQVASRARQAGIALTPVMMFRHRNIAELAAQLNSAKTAATVSAPIARVNRDAFRKAPANIAR